MFVLRVKAHGGEGRFPNSQDCLRSLREAKLMKKPSINLCGSLPAHSAWASGRITAKQTAYVTVYTHKLQQLADWQKFIQDIVSQMLARSGFSAVIFAPCVILMSKATGLLWVLDC